MKNILVTGTKGYIGNALKEWLEKEPGNYNVEMLNVRDENWRDVDFGNLDVVIHTAAIVHSKNRNSNEYEKVNVDLTKALAVKSKSNGVKQFVFMSTMGIFDSYTKEIDEKTVPYPKTLYAKSKLRAEKILEKEETHEFKVAIIRPPLVYGYKAPGNYQRLAKISRLLPVFPKIHNKRSMIYINNLTEFIKIIIEKNATGVFYPQNKEFVNTSNLYKEISRVHKKSSILLPKTEVFIKLFSNKIPTFQKVFGDFTYNRELPGGPSNNLKTETYKYETVGFIESIKLTEGGKHEEEI